MKLYIFITVFFVQLALIEAKQVEECISIKAFILRKKKHKQNSVLVKNKIGYELVKEAFAKQREHNLEKAIDSLYLMLEERKDHFIDSERQEYTTLREERVKYDTLLSASETEAARDQEIKISNIFFPFLIEYEYRIRHT